METIRRDQFVSEKTRENHLIHVRRLLNKLKHLFKMLWFSSDEKNSEHDKKVNRRSDIRLCRHLFEVQSAMHTKFPVIVMILEVINN